MNDALGLLEIEGLTPTMAAVDAMVKHAKVRILQCELNDLYGVSTKVAGSVEDVRAALEAGRRIAQRMGGRPVLQFIPRVDPGAAAVIDSPPEFNPLIQQDVVFTSPSTKESAMNNPRPPALGFIETQGFTAVFEAIDTACKAANVEVVGKEKLGGGYITVVVQGELSAVTSAIEAGKVKVGELGKLIAAHVIARPCDAVLSLLPALPK
ncbi:MAG: BMC domain-containing protein [Pirellulales bacterium]|nr:BMC domain-containing protein [Pirellulales bacterium]